MSSHSEHSGGNWRLFGQPTFGQQRTNQNYKVGVAANNVRNKVLMEGMVSVTGRGMYYGEEGGGRGQEVSGSDLAIVHTRTG